MLALLLLVLGDDAPPLTLPTSPNALHAARPTPLLEGRPGQWDAAIRERGWIVRDGDRWRLWYTGYDGTREGIKRVGHAVSDDGLAWIRSPEHPISPKGVWVEDCCVVRDGDRWVMLHELDASRVGWLTSPDGLDWTSHGAVAIVNPDGSPIPSGPTGTPVVLHHDGRWHLFFERYDRGVWRATSDDFATWTLASIEPVFEPSGRGFDAEMIAFNQIIRDGDRWVALYHGASKLDRPRLWANGAAVSGDLAEWTRWPANPLTPPAANLSSLMAIRDGDGWAFYTTHARIDRLTGEPADPAVEDASDRSEAAAATGNPVAPAP